MNGLTLLMLIAVALGAVAAYRIGRVHGRRQAPSVDRPGEQDAEAAHAAPSTTPSSPALVDPSAGATVEPQVSRSIVDEYSRLVRSYEAESSSLRAALAGRDDVSRRKSLDAAAAEEALQHELARVSAESMRYRQVIVDIENNAPPPLLDSPDAPDDLRLIVGVGPVLERLLQQLGVATYRQIARWSERDIDEFDAKLPEFPGRIRRDDWVTQARELHVSKYGERP